MSGPPAEATRPAASRPRATPRRPAARRGAWPAAVALIALVALGLRLWGHRHGLPYVYNADENAHFVPRAIGLFDHSWDPGYLVNPPAFTYLLHALFWMRWGGEGVQRTLAADPGAVFVLARIAAAVLGTGAVVLLATAGRRLIGAPAALLAAALSAVAFLPVHYGHFALNDAPALAPLALALVGVAGVVHRDRPLDHVVAGAGIGLATATKYTAAIALLAYLAAALGTSRPSRARARRAAVGCAVAAAAFVAANPYAVLDARAFAAALHEQSSAASDGGGKLGLPDRSGVAYYVETLWWGLGALPALAAVAGAAVLAVRDRRLLTVLAAPPLVCLLVLGVQDRFFARWLLPAYPFLCLLAAVGVRAAVDAAARSARVRAAAFVAGAVALCAQGVVLAVHNDVVLSRPDTRALARAWMVEHIPAGTKVVVEPIAPDAWAMDAGAPSRATGNGNRWNKWPTSRSRGRVVRLEDYERTLRPALVDSYARGGYCWVVTGSTQAGRAAADPAEVPGAIAYYAALARAGRVVHRVDPAPEPLPFSFDSSFNARPLSVERAGPAIAIHRLSRADCA